MTIITLSFDNGPEPDVTPLVLRTLRDHQIRSSFFVIGSKLRDSRHLSEMARAEGHWIGNHTYSHSVPFGAGVERGFATAEIERTQELIGDLAHERRFFRPYGGGGNIDRRLLNEEASELLQKGGYTCVLWNVIPRDWIDPEGWVERALDLCLAQEHSLVVLHDIPTGAMNRLDRFINEAKDRGMVFRQDFPENCVPIERGQVVRSIDDLVSQPAG